MSEGTGEAMDHREVFDTIVRECTTELFSGEGLPLELDGTQHPLDCVAVMGFWGQNVRAALGLGVTGALLERRGASVDLREDWLGELTNQLAGRIKNRLLRYDVVVNLALPMVLRGVSVQIARAKDVWVWSFRGPQEGVSVWLDARFDESFALVPRNDPGSQSAAEGDLVLF